MKGGRRVNCGIDVGVRFIFLELVVLLPAGSTSAGIGFPFLPDIDVQLSMANATTATITTRVSSVMNSRFI